MKLVRMVLALLFGGRFIAACDEGRHRNCRSQASDRGEPYGDRKLYDDEDDEGW